MGTTKIAEVIPEGLPQIYANGIGVGNTLTDVLLLLQQNGHPVAGVNLPFAQAKSLAVSLTKIISSVEETTGQHILSFEELQSLNKQEVEK